MQIGRIQGVQHDPRELFDLALPPTESLESRIIGLPAFSIQNRFGEAAKLYARAVEIFKAVLRPHDPKYAEALSKTAEALERQVDVTTKGSCFTVCKGKFVQFKARLGHS